MISAVRDSAETALLDAREDDPLELERSRATIRQALFAQPPPRQLGRYVLLKRIGSGGNGVVYSAVDTELGRKVAVKVLIRSSRTWRARFAEEARTLAALRHPNIVQIYDIGESDDTVFIAMEYVDGVTLRRWVCDGKPGHGELLGVLMGAARGLAYAHAQGLVHRDFKPDNVMVDAEGTARILDFGLAKRYGSIEQESPPEEDLAVPTEAPRTGTGLVMGTRGYIAPERMGGKEVDARSDQFSFCVTAFESLFGHRPFHDCVDARSGKPAYERVPSGRERVSIPRYLDRVISKGLSLDPSQRFPSMNALIRAVEHPPLRRVQRVALITLIVAGVFAVVRFFLALLEPGYVQLVANDADTPVEQFDLFVDGEQVEHDAGRAAVRPGTHVLSVRAPNTKEAFRSVEVTRGGETTIELALQPLTGTLDVDLEPRSGSISIDGVDYGSRVRNLELRTGRHQVKVRNEGSYSRWTDLELSQDDRQSLFFTLPAARLWAHPFTGVNEGTRIVRVAQRQPLVLHRHFHRVHAFDPATGDKLWNVVSPTNARHLDAEIDVDDDGIVDLVFAYHHDDDGVHVVRAEAWSFGTEQASLLWARSSPSNSKKVVDVRLLERPGGVALLVAEDTELHELSLEGRWRATTPLPEEAIAVGSTSDPQACCAVFVATATRIGRFDARDRLSPTPEWLLPRATGRETEVDRPLWVRDNRGNTELILLQADSVVTWNGENGRELWKRTLDPATRVFPTRTTPGRVVVNTVSSGSVLDSWSGEMVFETRHGPLGRDAFLGNAVILPSAGAGRLHLHDVTDGALVADHPFDLAPVTVGAVSLDWNGDETPEILVGGRRGLAVYDERGLVAEITELGSPTLVAAHEDLDGDGLPDLLLADNGPKVLAGSRVLWHRGATDAFRSTPLVGDFDGDGAAEVIVFAAIEGEFGLHALDARTGALRGTAPGSDPRNIRAPLAWSVGTEAHFVFMSGDHGLVRSGLGATAPHSWTPVSFGYATPLRVNLDGRPGDEVLVAGWDPGSLSAYSPHREAMLWSVELPTAVWATPRTLRAPPDGPTHVVIADMQGRVMLIEGTTGRELWRRELGCPLPKAPLLADWDRDGRLEIIVTSCDDLVVLSSDGEIVETFSGLGNAHSRPVMVDDGGNGQASLLVGTTDARAVAMSADGTESWSRSLSRHEAASVSSPVVLADPDRDGHPEAFFTTTDGRLTVIDVATGEELWHFDMPGGETIEATVVSYDVDGDGREEIVVAGHNRRIFCLRF